MARTCTVCAHEKRAQIEAAIVARQPNRRIAAQFGLSATSIRRHTSEHISETIQHVQEAKEELHALNVTSEMAWLNQQAHLIYKEVKDAKKPDYHIALSTLAEIRKQTELWAKLQGDLDERARVNIAIMPEWLAIQKTIMQALQPYSEARTVVSEALAQLE